MRPARVRPAWSRALLGMLVLAGCATPEGDTREEGALVDADGYALVCEGLARGNASWTEPCLALASPNDSPSKTETDVVVDPSDPLHVVVGSKDNDKTASDCVWAIPQVSHDGGASWTPSIIGGAKSARRPGDYLFGWECVTDPIMAFDDEGTLYYSLQLYDYVVEGTDLPAIPDLAPPAAGSAIALARSKDGGATWDKIITLHAGDGNAILHDYMRMAFNPKTGSVYTAWNQYSQGANLAVVVATRDGGETASPPTYLRPTGSAEAGAAGIGSIATANDGTVYVMLEAATQVWLSTSTDDGRTFSEPAPVASFTPIPRMLRNNTFRTITGVELAVDRSEGPRDGCIYATWTAYEDDDPNIRLLSSCDRGETWSEPVNVNQAEWERGDQWMARPVVDRRGTLHVVYFDRSRDLANWAIDATWARSTDGGRTFVHTRLTQTPFDGGLGMHQDGAPFIGDYIGIGSAGDSLYMGFPTTITGRAEIAVAKVRIVDGT